MKRKLSVIEHLVFETFEKENIHFAFTAGITGSFTYDGLTSAIVKIRTKHPLLSVRIDVDSKGRAYFVSDNLVGPLIRIVDRNSDEQWINEEWAELHTPIDLRNGPVTRFVWIKGEHKSELIFVCHHIISDGRAAAYVLRDILFCLGDLNYEIKPYKMLPGVAQLIPKKIRLNPFFLINTKRSALKKIKEIKKNAAGTKEIKQPKIYHTEYTILHWELTREQTDTLLNRAREEKTSIHPVIHVAMLEAFSKTLGRNEVPLVVKTPTDIKNKLSSKLKEDTLGTSFAIPKYMAYKYKPRKNFWQMARDIKGELAKQIDVKTLFFELTVLEYLRPVASYLASSIFPVNPADSISFLTLSNMGILDIPLLYGSVKLDFFQVSAPILGNEHILLLMSVGGKMYFSLVTSKEKMDKEQSQQIKKQFLASLEKAICWYL